MHQREEWHSLKVQIESKKVNAKINQYGRLIKFSYNVPADTVLDAH